VTKIEDMSEPQRQAWITLLADGVLGVVIITVILHAVIAAIFDIRKRKEPYEKDERDITIERKGAHWGYRLMQWGVGGVIVIMALNGAIGADFLPPISLEKPAEIVFALLVISYVADLVKQGIMIWAYRD